MNTNGWFLGFKSLETSAQESISRYHTDNEPPYYVSDLCEKFQELDGIYQADLATNISGYIRKNQESKYRIVTNSNDPENRRRFTAAHELAHFLLHKEYIGDGITDDALYRSNLSNWQEVEANKLAAHILMPYEKINELIDEKHYKNSELPGLFKVSAAAMSIRLGMTEWQLVHS